jgi:AraC-like DNA-binding protein
MITDSEVKLQNYSKTLSEPEKSVSGDPDKNNLASAGSVATGLEQGVLRLISRFPVSDSKPLTYEVVGSNSHKMVGVALSLSKLRGFAEEIADDQNKLNSFTNFSTAKNNCKDENILRKRQPKPLKGDELQKAIADYENGKRLTDIAREHGFSRWFLTKQFREAGAVIRRQAMTDEQIRIAKRLYSSGFTLKQVGEQMDIPKATVRDAFVTAGFERRDSHTVTNRSM